MVVTSPSRQRQPPCKTTKVKSDEAADAAALTTYLLLLAVWRPVARAGIPQSPRTSNLLQFLISRVLASDGNSYTVQPVLSAVHESGRRHGSDGGKECQTSSSGDKHPRGTDQRHVVEEQWEAQVC